MSPTPLSALDRAAGRCVDAEALTEIAGRITTSRWRYPQKSSQLVREVIVAVAKIGSNSHNQINVSAGCDSHQMDAILQFL
jgi:hypothetical protein